MTSNPSDTGAVGLADNPSVGVERDRAGRVGDFGVAGDAVADGGTGCMACGARPRVNRSALCSTHYAEAITRVRDQMAERPKRGRAKSRPIPRTTQRTFAQYKAEEARKAAELAEQRADKIVAFVREQGGGPCSQREIRDALGPDAAGPAFRFAMRAGLLVTRSGKEAGYWLPECAPLPHVDRVVAYVAEHPGATGATICEATDVTTHAIRHAVEAGRVAHRDVAEGSGYVVTLQLG